MVLLIGLGLGLCEMGIVRFWGFILSLNLGCISAYEQKWESTG